jgi:predicted metal-dependent hydrolase
LRCSASPAGAARRRRCRLLKREAKSDLEKASKQAALALGVSIKRVSIRDQSSRWGSCSTTGVLSYSWRLILAPSYVLDYLAAHEAAHLIEMNHSRAFWRLVDRICPHMSRAKAWLDAHGTGLHRYGLQDD